jgi:nicotinate-nucleotide pyrophosphorylase (carboxylating)
MPLNKNQKFKIQNIIKQALKEDIGRDDITTSLLIPEYLKIKAIILAKEKGVIAGVDIARLVFRAFDRRIKFKPRVKDTESVKADTLIANLEGPAKGILAAERTALNFLSRLSGIATLTKKFVERVKPYKVKIMDTRKTTPNLRILEKYAVRIGGGHNHRMGLFDMVLIKENHLKVLGVRCWVLGKKNVIEETIKSIKKNIKIRTKVKIEIEVKNLREFKQALKLRPDIIMLDNMDVKKIKKAVQIRKDFFNLKPKTYNLTPKLEVSGRITLKNVREIAKTGVEMISIGSLTHSVKSLDISLEVIR